MSKYKVLALFGKSGAGKDTIKKRMCCNHSEIKEIISCTTRSPREYERNGIDYYFLSHYDFERRVRNKDIIDAVYFKKWLYGTSIQELDKNKINVGVFSIAGIKQLLIDERIEVLPVLIEVPGKERLKRSLRREHNPDCREICRRFLADERDFSDINFEYVTFYNESDYAPSMFDSFPPVQDFIHGQ